jgi:hypothetical protein
MLELPYYHTKLYIAQSNIQFHCTLNVTAEHKDATKLY